MPSIHKPGQVPNICGGDNNGLVLALFSNSQGLCREDHIDVKMPVVCRWHA